MPTMKLNNLNDVRQFVTENLPGWTISCGKRTWISARELHPAEDYEVIQLYSPKEKSAPFAEFWRGFYDFYPDKYDGFVGRGFHCFSCHGGLEFAMRDVMEEHERLNMCPKIIKAINVAVSKDEELRRVYKAVSYADIRANRGNHGTFWAVDCEDFCCKDAQRCVMTLESGVKENAFEVKYRLETWRNGHYEVDVQKAINVEA